MIDGHVEICCILGTAPLRCFCASVGNCPEVRSAFIASRLKGGALQPQASEGNGRLAECMHACVYIYRVDPNRFAPAKGLAPRLETKTDPN